MSSEEVSRLPIVLVTGSRRRSDGVREALQSLLEDLGPFEVVVGCADGVDAVARAWADSARKAGVKLTVFSDDWGRAMADYVSASGAESVCIALPCPDSKTAWDCVREASMAGIAAIVRPIGAENGPR